MTNEYLEKTGYWGVEYFHGKVSILIMGDRGYLEHKINGIFNALSEYEPLMKNVHVASEKNIRFALHVIKRYVEDVLI